MIGSNSSLSALSEHDVPEHFLILYGLYRSIFSVIGNVGNILVIIAVLSFRKLRTRTNVFVLSLAFADLSITAFVEPVAVGGIFGQREKLYEKWPGLCSAVASVCVVSCGCSLWTIGAIAITRYICICKNELYNKLFTWMKTISIAIVIWLLSIIANVSNYFGWGGYRYDPKFKSCGYDRLADYGHVLLTVLIFVSTPILCIIVCYTRVYLTLRRSSNRLRDMAPNYPQRDTPAVTNKDVKLLKMLFSIFITYVSCWTPVTLLYVIDFADRLPTPVYIVAGLMVHMSSVINPILYGLMNQNFRDAYKKILSCGRWKPNEIHPESRPT